MAYLRSTKIFTLKIYVKFTYGKPPKIQMLCIVSPLDSFQWLTFKQYPNN